ncbi:tetratricopeptide repeat protein [Candidatus Microgenomates bacterium]|nr:tetratricopeptide repeat protein [Candidatus Microgenomates bacterium]
MSNLAQAAISETLKRNFDKAIELNRAILKETPHDIEALNRLAFAYLETGRIKEARQIYNKVLSINKFNPIAIKNLKRLSLFAGRKVSPSTNNGQSTGFQGLFVEEVGKTKIAALIHLAEAKIISMLQPTNQVLLLPRRRGITVTAVEGAYIGALPDDIAKRLYVLIKGGNKYEAYIKSVDKNSVSIFIRELHRQPKFKNQPSFLGRGSTYYPFVRDEALAEEDKPEVSRLEDSDEEEELKGGPEPAPEEAES